MDLIFFINCALNIKKPKMSANTNEKINRKREKVNNNNY